ncbi:MAG: nitroreductase family protein [Thermoplasmatota archaeon]
MDTYESIFRRRSVRKYSDEKLSSSLLNKLDKYTEELNKLYEDIDIDVHIVKDGSKIQNIMSGIIGSYGKIRAPHYMIITSEQKDGYLENVGFALEPVILKLTTAKIGTCWIGGHVPKDRLEDILDIKESHEAVIVISLGYAENNPLRDRKQAKRKSISDITVGNLEEGWKEMIESARFAPSAVNSQPWRFKSDKNKLHAYSVKRSRFTKMIASDLHLLNRIDVGIALSHIKIASDKSNRNIRFRKLDDAPEIKKLKYISSVIKN